MTPRATATRARLALIALLAGCGAREEMPVREVVLDLLSAPDRIEARAHPDGLPPEVGAITPSIDAYSDAGELPALVLPPDSVVEIALPALDGPLALRAAAGVDLSVPRALPPGAELLLRFRIELDGAAVFDETVTVRHKPRDRTPMRAPLVWRRAGGVDGLPVRGGQRLTLSTQLVGGTAVDPRLLRVGFGPLVLERTRSVERTTASAGRPNVVLVVMDTLRADRTSLAGNARPTTPRLAELAARGTAYERACSTAPWTWPATASLLTGLPPEAHGVVSHRECFLAHELDTLAEVLQRGGATTAAFVANPLVSRARNFDQGFETFQGVPDFTPGAQVLPDVLAWLQANRERRFFLYVHLVDPHAPHRPEASQLARLGLERPADFPVGSYERIARRVRAARLLSRDGAYELDAVVPPATRAWIDASYDACVATGDLWLGALLDELAALHLDGTTVVAFTSDHGEELLEHGLYDHASSLHPELVEVPLVLAGPGVPAGRRVATPVSNRHLAPTLARLAGVALPAADDALDLARPDAVEARDLFYSTAKGVWGSREMVAIRGVRAGGWALHHAPQGLPFGAPAGRDPGDGELRLYDLAADPRELHDVASAHPDRVRELRAGLDEWDARQRARRPRVHRSGAATLELLEQIGYAPGDEPGDEPGDAAHEERSDGRRAEEPDAPRDEEDDG